MHMPQRGAGPPGSHLLVKTVNLIFSQECAGMSELSFLIFFLIFRCLRAQDRGVIASLCQEKKSGVIASLCQEVSRRSRDSQRGAGGGAGTAKEEQERDTQQCYTSRRGTPAVLHQQEGPTRVTYGRRDLPGLHTAGGTPST